jgi:cytochrome c
MRRLTLGAVVGVAGLAFLGTPAETQVGRSVSFAKDVLPIFQRSCQNCHGVDQRGGLKLDSHENVMLGGAKGRVVIPRNPEGSRLIQFVEGRLQPRMPVGGQPLPRTDIATLRAWIQQGAKDDAGAMAGAAAAEKPLELMTPKDGAEVKEKVKITVPRASIPPEGFVAIYIDKRFKVALAPMSEEELEDKGLKPDAPLEYIWDTKAPISDDPTIAAEDRIPRDGPHVVEVRSYNSEGALAETVTAQVNLANSVQFNSNEPVPLRYGGVEGQQYVLEHTVELEANAAQAGFGRSAQAAVGGPDKLSHKETTQYLVSLEDYMPATGTGFWRERRESPIVVVVNGVKHVVRLDTSSRYYSMERTGEVRKSKVMERELREPILNPLDLPGRPQRMNEPFETTLRINLGAYIPAAMTVERLQATLEGIEWQHGEECIRIRLNYLAGNSKIDINSMQIKGADFQIQQGTSTIWFSRKTNRVVRASHDLTGNLVVDLAQLGAGQSPEGGPGGEYAPGGPESPYPSSGYPGSGYPGSGYPGMPGSAPMFGAPFGGAPAPAPGMFGAPFGGAPGSAPYGGSPYGGSPYGGSSGMYPGSSYPGAYPGAAGGGTGLPGPTTKRYHVKLKVTTDVMDEEPAAKPSTSSPGS